MTTKEYDNTNRGALFVNQRKETEKHPDYNGNINIDGKEFWVSGWKSFSKKDGKMYLSLSIKPKDTAPASKPRPAFGVDESFDDSDIPF